MSTNYQPSVFFFLSQTNGQTECHRDRLSNKEFFIIIVYRKETKLRPDRQSEVTLGIVSYYGIVVVIWFFFFFGKRINYCKIFILFIFLGFAFTIYLLLFCVFLIFNFSAESTWVIFFLFCFRLWNKTGDIFLFLLRKSYLICCWLEVELRGFWSRVPLIFLILLE